MHNSFDGAPTLFEERHHRGSVANVQIVMFVTANIRDQIVARFFSGSFDAEKFCAHIVIDPDHASAVAGETPDRFRAD